MGAAAELLRPVKHDRTPDPLPLVMAGQVLQNAPLMVAVDELDNGQIAHQAFGHYPTAAAGDEVRVVIDAYGQLVVVAWEPAV